MGSYHIIHKILTRKILINCTLIAIIALILLEINRLYTPLNVIQMGFIRNIAIITLYVIFPLVITFIVVNKGKLIDMFSQGIICAISSWLIWVFLLLVYSTIKTIFWGEDSIHFSLDYIIPLVGLFFIYFFIGCLSGSMICYIREL